MYRMLCEAMTAVKWQEIPWTISASRRLETPALSITYSIPCGAKNISLKSEDNYAKMISQAKKKPRFLGEVKLVIEEAATDPYDVLTLSIGWWGRRWWLGRWRRVGRIEEESSENANNKYLVTEWLIFYLMVSPQHHQKNKKSIASSKSLWTCIPVKTNHAALELVFQIEQLPVTSIWLTTIL